MRKLITLIVTLAIVLVMPASAFASHQGPQSGPPNKWLAYYLQGHHATQQPAHEEYTMSTWFTYQEYPYLSNGNETLDWWASSGYGVDGHLATAIGRWKNVSDYPDYLRTSVKGSDPIVGIGSIVADACGVGSYGCVSPNQWTYHMYVHVNTMRKAYIYFTNKWVNELNSAQKTGVATHEWGHVLGLGEQYYTITGCQSTSVMCRIDQATYYPTSTDRTNLLNLHLSGSHDNVGAWYDVGADRFVTEWRNKSLSESAVVIDHYWSTSGGPTWVHYNSTLQTINNGVDYIIDGETDEDFHYVFNPPGMGAPTNVYVMACSYPGHGINRAEYWDKNGNGVNDENYRCSTGVYFPN